MNEKKRKIFFTNYEMVYPMLISLLRCKMTAFFFSERLPKNDGTRHIIKPL